MLGLLGFQEFLGFGTWSWAKDPELDFGLKVPQSLNSLNPDWGG